MEEPPAWRGINLHTAETLRFAATSQLLQTYLECLRFPVSPAIVHAWLLHSHQGQTSPDGMPHGLGSAQLLGGLTYHGSFKGGLLHGQGTLTKDGVSYSGGFSYNCIHGSGTYRWEKGASYNGQVYQGLPHGDGLMYTGDEDCCTYEGAWKHGLRHGQGKLIYGKDGTTKYEGRWVHDRKHGEGSQIYGSGSTYQGSWLEGKKDGRGRLVALSSPEPSLSSYQAGLGRLALARVYIYEGDWINDLPSGSGKSVWMSDEKEECSNHLLNSYIGEFERGLRHGQGCFFYASGSFYKGGWNENKKNGNGLYIYENGKVLCGTFVCDHFVLQEEACPVVKEPLHSLLEGEENMEVIKDKVTNVLLRHNSALKEIFSIYRLYKMDWVLHKSTFCCIQRKPHGTDLLKCINLDTSLNGGLNGISCYPI